MQSTVDGHGEGKAPEARVHQAQTQHHGLQVNGPGDKNVGNVHFGNINNFGPSKTQVTEKNIKEKLIESLEFPGMENRFLGIDENAPQTCQWLLKTAEWKEWEGSFPRPSTRPLPCRQLFHRQAPGRRLFWIKGRAGTGKSTYVKFLLQHSWNSKAFKGNIVLSHFFVARSVNALQKSTEGMYRSMSVQLLRKLSPEEVAQINPAVTSTNIEHWELGRLKTFFLAVVQKCGRPVTCFIDALDECNDDQVRDMLTMFTDQINKDREAIPLRVCFSSRHYPSISVPGDTEIDFALEKQAEHLKDVERYIESRLCVSSSPLSEIIQREVKKKANGVYIWCKHVVEIINKECDKGRLTEEKVLRSILDNLPQDLHQLYARILGLDGDAPGDQAGALLCLQWVLLHDRPLTIGALWRLIQRGIYSEVEANELDEKYQNESKRNMRLYITNISRGLVDFISGVALKTYIRQEKEELIAQVNHESVRDFLLGGSGLAQLMTAVGKWHSDLDEAEARARSHEELKSILYRDLCQSSSLARASASPDRWFDLLDDYATLTLQQHGLSVVMHANKAQLHGLDQSRFLQDLGQRPFLQRWTVLCKAIGEVYPFVVSGTEGSELSLMEMLIAAKAGALFRLAARLHFNQNQQEGAALTSNFGLLTTLDARIFDSLDKEGRVEIFQILVDMDLQQHEHNPARHETLRHLTKAIDFEAWNGWHRLPGTVDMTGVAALGRYNAGLGIFSTMMLLPENYDDQTLLEAWEDSSDNTFSSFLFQVLRYLTYSEAIRIVDLQDALMLAAIDGSRALARMLLDEFHVSPTGRNPRGTTPLHFTILYQLGAVLELLIAHDDIELNALDSYGMTPLLYAYDLGKYQSAKPLLATDKVNVNAQDQYGNTSLHLIFQNEPVDDFSMKHLEILLAKPEVNVNAQNYEGYTPLHLACDGGCYEPVRALLKTNGVDVKTKDKFGRTALRVALEEPFPPRRRHLTATKWPWRRRKIILGLLKAYITYTSGAGESSI